MKKVSKLLPIFLIVVLLLASCAKQSSSSPISLPLQSDISETTKSESNTAISQEIVQTDDPLTPEDIKEYFENVDPEEIDGFTAKFYANGTLFATDLQKESYGDSIEQMVYEISFSITSDEQDYYFDIAVGLQETDGGILYTGNSNTLKYQEDGIYSATLIPYNINDATGTPEDFTITFCLEKIPEISIKDEISFTLRSYEGNSNDEFMENFKNILNTKIKFINWEMYKAEYISS